MFGKQRIYLDWASAAPVSARAKATFLKALAADGNPSAAHAEGRAAKDILEEARTTIARLAEVKSDAVIFTSGATEANNLALSGFIQAFRSAHRGQTLHVLYLPTAHASVIETLHMLSTYGVEIEALKLLDGAIDLNVLKQQIKPETVLVVVDAVCGETGTRFNTRDVRRAIGNTALHVDASQLPLTESFELTRLGADSITLDAQKVGGVRGIGALILRHGHTIAPIMHGGGQEFGLRPGTESPALAAAFAEALIEPKENREAFVARASEARTQLIETIRAAIPNVEVNEGKQQSPNILNLSFPNRDTDYALALLDAAGFAVATRSACETDAEGSRVVLAYTGDAARAASTIRISWGPTTSDSQLKRFGNALIAAIRFLDSNPL